MLRCSPRSIRPDAAVTLIELMVSLVIAGILMVGVGSIVITAVETAEEANARLALERHAHYATTFIQRRVRAKPFDEVSIGQDGALILNHGEAEEQTFYLQGRNVVWTHSGGQENLVEDAADFLSFAVEEGHAPGRYLLRIELRVSHGGRTLEIEDLAAMRN